MHAICLNDISAKLVSATVHCHLFPLQSFSEAVFFSEVEKKIYWNFWGHESIMLSSEISQYMRFEYNMCGPLYFFLCLFAIGFSAFCCVRMEFNINRKWSLWIYFFFFCVIRLFFRWYLHKIIFVSLPHFHAINRVMGRGREKRHLDRYSFLKRPAALSHCISPTKRPDECKCGFFFIVTRIWKIYSFWFDIT